MFSSIALKLLLAAGIPMTTACATPHGFHNAALSGATDASAVSTPAPIADASDVWAQPFELVLAAAPMTLDQASIVVSLSDLPASTFLPVSRAPSTTSFRVAGLGAGDVLGMQVRHQARAIALLDAFRQHAGGSNVATVPVPE